jgi:hypothetical protein
MLAGKITSLRKRFGVQVAAKIDPRLRKQTNFPNISATFSLRIETEETSAQGGTVVSPQRLCGSVERGCL